MDEMSNNFSLKSQYIHRVSRGRGASHCRIGLDRCVKSVLKTCCNPRKHVDNSYYLTKNEKNLILGGVLCYNLIW
jgi:hypothetical protein